MNVNGNDISIEIGASGKQAVATINAVTNSLLKFKQAASSKTGNPLKNFKSAVKLKIDSSDADKATKKISVLQKAFSALKRIAFYRAIRSAIKNVTDGFKEGLENAYQFSKSVDGPLANALDSLSSAGFKMKNQLGAAFGQLIVAVTPILLTLIDIVTAAANAVTQFFAILSGQTTYKKAKNYWKEWGETASGAGKAAKEALKYLAPFDELNVLPSDRQGGGSGGGASTPNYEDMFEIAEVEKFWKKLSDLIGKLKINFKDVFFDWSNLNEEQISKKLIVGLGAVLGGIAGFTLGGVPGAIIGTLTGVGIGLLIDSLIFDNDGIISGFETMDMIRMALLGLTGGVIGFFVGGPGGAALGATIGLGLFAGIKAIDFFTDGKATGFLNDLTEVLGAFVGGIIGFKVGGPAGALIGATLGFGISFALQSFLLDDTSGWNAGKWVSSIVAALAPAAGAIIGLMVGGPAGAAVGALIGFGIHLGIKGFAFADTSNWKSSDWIRNIVAALAPFAGATVGLVVGGPVGAAIGAAIGLGIHFLLKTDPKADGQKTGNGFFQGIWESVTKKWNDLKRWWQSLDLGSFHIKTPHLSWYTEPARGWIGSVLSALGLPSSVPKLSVSWYARGGIVDGASLIGAGEAGKEAIVPLERNTQWVGMVADQLSNQLGNRNGGGYNADLAGDLEDANGVVVSAIFSATAEIVRAMQRNSGSAQSGNIDIDSIARQVTRWQNNAARANGI